MAAHSATQVSTIERKFRMENNEYKQKPFKITIETRDEKFVKIGGAQEVRVIECDGYFLSCCETVDNGEKKVSDGFTACQGMINALLIAEGIHNVDDVMGVSVEGLLHTLNSPDGELTSMLKNLPDRSDEDGERTSD